jgi:membrane-bound lytic murein transglycosylase D
MLFPFGLVFSLSCATNPIHVKPPNPTPRERAPATEVHARPSAGAPANNEAAVPNIEQKEKSVAALPTPPVSPKNSPPPPPKKPPQRSDQELLDSALEFCQASNDFWERGELEDALDALDQAYSLILKVDPEDHPEILQQRDDLRITISKRIIACYSSRYTVANGYHKAIPLVMNKHVERALNLLKGKERDFFLEAYQRSGRYRALIVRALTEAGLPEELSWLPLIESGFKTGAMSRARALGLWQFIASTGYKYGLTRDRWTDERMDPEKSTAAAIAYLKELHQIFGDWTTVLAAYNCGEGRVLRAIRTQRINYLDNFWDLYERLPIETAFYVPKFLAVLHLLSNPEAYGLTLPPVDDPVETEAVTIDKPVHLKTVAKHLGVSYSLLRDLNPELRRDSTPDKPYALKVPLGKGPVLLSKLSDIPAWQPPVPAYVWHRVWKGETLSVIARRYRSSVRAIMAMNGLKSSRFIRAGWKLKIPSGQTYASRQEPSLASARSTEGYSQYTVRQGDSLWKIASQFGTTTQTIQSLNQLANTHLRIGQILRIPEGTAPPREPNIHTYVVSKGDSPFMIAQEHQMNLADFLRLNNLTPRSRIFPGQTLLVKAE